jgi:WD40 repeat protein
MLWSLPSRKPIGRLGRTEPGQITFSHDSRAVAVAGAGGIWLWDFGARHPPDQLAHPGAANVAFSADDRTLASSSDVDGVRLWDVPSRQPLGQLSDSGAESLAFAAHGRALATANGLTGQVTLWDPILWSSSADEIRRWICPRIRSELTPAEWRRFLPGEPYRSTCRP